MEHKYMRMWIPDPLLEPKLRPGMALLPWQRLGVNFLHFHRYRAGFACLADEMGVGKVVSDCVSL